MPGTLGGKIGDLPTIYLGMPLGAKTKSKGMWNKVSEKCALSKWKSQYMSRGGRLTLISSVLDALPTYMMYVFPTPDYVIQRIDALRRNFLWQGTADKKFHLIKWVVVMKSRKEGVWGSGT